MDPTPKSPLACTLTLTPTSARSKCYDNVFKLLISSAFRMSWKWNRILSIPPCGSFLTAHAFRIHPVARGVSSVLLPVADQNSAARYTCRVLLTWAILGFQPVVNKAALNTHCKSFLLGNIWERKKLSHTIRWVWV